MRHARPRLRLTRRGKIVLLVAWLALVMAVNSTLPSESELTHLPNGSSTAQ